MAGEQVNHRPALIANNPLHLRINFSALGVIELSGAGLEQFVESFVEGKGSHPKY
jgi:hypothetical protein